jgi:hypothetical protein
MIELSRAEFDAWVKSEVGKMFSHGKIASIEFYYLIWKAGMAAGIERAAQRVENGRFLHDDAPTARFARECAAAIRALVTAAPDTPPMP